MTNIVQLEGLVVGQGEAWSLEATVASEWLGTGHGQPDDLARRKRAIIDRGRTQIVRPEL